MKKALAVARWEYLEKIKSKEFLISLVLTPIIMIVFGVLPSLLATQEDDTTKGIGLIDSTQVFETAMKEKLGSFTYGAKQPRYIVKVFDGTTIEQSKKTANDAVQSKEIDGYLYISGNAEAGYNLEYRSQNSGSMQDLRRFEDGFNDIRISFVFKERNISSDVADLINKKYEIRSIKIDKTGKETNVDFMGQFSTTMIFIMAMFFVIMLTGGQLIRSLVEEKSNRLIEILISSCRPNDLLTGKILGLTMLVFTQLFVWALLGIALAGQSLAFVISFENMALMLVYFILGFVFFTSLFVGLGSIVNTEQEAQQLTGYLSMILVLPVVFIVPLLQNPEGNLVKIMSYIPFTIPSIMLARLNISEVPPLDIILSIAILLLSIFLVIFVSSKIFRIGILSYGKVPSLKELAKWIRSSD